MKISDFGDIQIFAIHTPNPRKQTLFAQGSICNNDEVTNSPAYRDYLSLYPCLGVGGFVINTKPIVCTCGMILPLFITHGRNQIRNPHQTEYLPSGWVYILFSPKICYIRKSGLVWLV